MYFIVGLGNPGEKYAGTRHNVGRSVLEFVAGTISGAEWSKDKLANAATARALIAGVACELLLPETYMNKSGDTVRYLVEKQGVNSEHVIVVHDDIDLPFGEIKVGKGRGAGGNNGVQSIIQAVGTKDFVRVRIGIAPKSFWTGKVKRPAGGGPLEQFVLQSFSGGEKKLLPEVYEKTREALALVVGQGVEMAMNRCN